MGASLVRASSVPVPDVPCAVEDTRVGMCDAFDGVTFTFCVALCEARTCDLRDADDAACMQLRRGFARVSGGSLLPCDASAVGEPL